MTTTKSPPGLSRKFKVNKTNKYNDNRQQPRRDNNRRDNNYQQKKDNIFLLTVDNYYFIIEKKYIKRAHFFERLFMVDETSGHLRNPIFLQKIKSTPFKYIIQYLKRYYNYKDEKFEMSGMITLNDLYSSYENEWDKTFIKEIHQKYRNNTEELEELLKATQYIGVLNLYNKLKYCYDFIINTKTYKLDELESDNENDFIDMMDEINLEC